MRQSVRTVFRVMNKWLDGTILWGWIRWHQAIDEFERNRRTMRLMESTVRKIVYGKLNRAWVTWRGLVKAQKRAGKVMMRTLDSLFYGTLVWGFGRWSGYLNLLSVPCLM